MAEFCAEGSSLALKTESEAPASLAAFLAPATIWLKKAACRLIMTSAISALLPLATSCSPFLAAPPCCAFLDTVPQPAPNKVRPVPATPSSRNRLRSILLLHLDPLPRLVMRLSFLQNLVR